VGTEGLRVQGSETEGLECLGFKGLMDSGLRTQRIRLSMS
jgi:hypothetical protein